MESPVVVDKPPEYHGNAPSNERGFPFDEEEGSGAWSELAARHPDIAARLRQRPATWARKRRPSSQDADDFGDSFGGFDRFPFDDIPTEFRDHFPSHWNRRFGSRDDIPPQPQPQAQTSQSPPQQHTAATQTEHDAPPEQTLPQYGLRNTVDLGQKSPADPSLVDADDRNQRSMSAPPESRTSQPANMSGQNHQEPQREQPSNVRVIPIVVEGRDEPVINRTADHGTHFTDSKPAHAPPQQPHIDREQYFADDGPIGYAQPPNFTRSFGAPFTKFRQGPQPFVQQKVYPQSASAFGRGASPQRSQSPKPHTDEHYVKVPVHHEQTAPKTEPPRQQQKQPSPQQRQPPPPQQQHAPQQPSPRQQSPPQQPKPQPSANDPISQILIIQTDVLNLMTDVENFKGTKKDKEYMFLDEMLTRNLIKLDTIETDGKENIRQARKEAIKCIQKCIAVLEAKADNKTLSTPQPQEIDTNEQKTTENGEVEMESKEIANVESQIQAAGQKPEEKTEQPVQNKEAPPQAADTRPEEKASSEGNVVGNQENIDVEKKADPKKGAKNIKKRDKSKDKEDTLKETVSQDTPEENKEVNKVENTEPMQVDDKGEKPNSQTMEVDAPSQ